MDAPLNEKIERTLKRKAARKKDDSNFMPVLSLHQQVLALVNEANSKVSHERHVTPRSALIVMNRSLASLSSLDSDAKDFAVLREVSRFLNVATKTFTASQTHNTDLLVAGHPLSTLNASLSGEEFLKKNAQWIAADPSIDESIRPLVASAHAATPGSLEREHAFARLNANKTLLASYFKIDNLSPIIAAFGSGNSSAARRARVALQWRDRKGRWVEMGRGADFNFRMPDGSVARASGVYVGVRPQRAGENFTAGLIQVSGDKNLPDGIYAVRAGDVETYAARLTPAQLEKAGVSSKVKVDQNQVNIPTRDNLVAERVDAPTGWTKVDDNTFTSDDNYTAKVTDGEYTLYRQNADGSLADKVGDAGNWADVNDLANGDQEAYDAVKGQDSSAQQQQIKARLDGRTAHNAEFDRLEELVKSGVDQNGNTVPDGWEGVVKPGRAADVQRRDIGADIVYAEEGLPSVEYRKKIADDNGDPVFAEAEFYSDGTFAAYDKKYNSWEEAEADIPRWIKAEEDRRGRKLTPVNDLLFQLPPARDDRAGFFDKDGNRLLSPDNVIKEPKDLKVGDEVYIPNVGWRKIKSISKDEKRLEGRKKTLPLYKIEYEDENSDFGQWKWTPLSEDGQGNKIKGLETRTPIDEQLSSLTEEQNKKIDAEIRDLIKNPPAPTEMDKRVEKLLKEQREEYDKAKEKYYAKVFDRDERIGGKDDFLGPEKTRKLQEEFRKSLEDSPDGPPIPGIPPVPTGKEIYERRMAGESLDKVAKDLGLTREEVRRIESKYGRTLDENPTPDEPPTPPSGGTPPKTPSPNVPSAPGLFNGFNVPDGAFKLNAVDYTPEGRIDEASSDFTDDPQKLAIRFTPQDLVQALSQALLGNSSDAALAEILNANVDDDNDILDPAEIQDSVNIPQVNLGVPSGAGQLEFNAGAEFVPAEALFNAIWEAGLDPNRVVANIYDSVNGNNDNLNKLIDAQGGVPSQEEAQLVDDIVQEIRQLKDASEPGDSPVANEKQTPSPDPLPGALIENIPIDFGNPDYYIPNSEAYIPSQPEVDENGYTDNPEILSADYEVADLIEQMLSGITDGSGAALLAFDNITVEVPIEAMRDAIQYQGINTNQILLDLKKESNDMGDTTPPPAPESPALQAHSQMIKDLVEQTGNTLDDDTADKIRDAIDEKGLLDWSEADDAEIIEAITEVAGTGILEQVPTPAAERRFPPTTGERQAIETPVEEVVNPNEPFGSSEILNELAASIKNTFSSGFSRDTKILALLDDANESMIVMDPGQGQEAIMFRKKRGQDLYITSTNAEADWYTGSGAQALGWRSPTAGEQISLRNYVGEMLGEETLDAPVAEAPAAPSLVYPGPENRGYSADNTVLDIAGKVMGNGTRIRASRDGRMGTVTAVQNIDSRTGERIPYVRVRFDDGSVAVRSALKVRATGDAEQAVPTDAARQAPTPAPVPDISSRLDAPVLNPGAIATEGNIQGVNSLGTTPDRLVEFTNPDAKQSDYSAWGLRAGEIARAGQDRVKLESIKKAAIDHQLAILEFRSAPAAQKDALSLEVTKKKEILDAMMKDTYGVRDGLTFGKNGYSLSFGGSSVYLSGTKEELQSGNQPISLSIAMNVLDSNGRSIGTINRTISAKQATDPNTGEDIFEWEVKNNYLAINNAKDKKSGFATAYNRFMENWYVANGVKEIHVQAAGGGSYQGGFVWALNGFNWETPRSAESEVFTRLRMMRRVATNKGEIAQIERLLEKATAAKLRDGGLDLDKAPTPMELALVGWYPGAKTWTGKDLMARNGWMGVKRLDPAAKEQVQSVNYDQLREARKRIEAKENKPNVGREFVMTANSNEFQNKNPELGEYLTEIRDVLQNNRSLAALSPAAKTALNKYVTKQLLTKEGRDLTMQDIFQLRKALQAEAKADNPLLNSTDFGVGKDLASATIEDISRNRVEGFQIKRLGMYESGYNDTWLATHVASGQRFYVKKDDLATNYDINGPLSEIAATNIARGIGFEGVYNTLASNDNPNVLVMQEAGATLPLGSEIKMASNVYDGSSGTLTALDGSKVTFNGDNFIDKMHTPEDAVRIVLLDLLINNQDRHNGNVLYALDGVDPSKIRIFPIDHSLSSFALKPGDRDQYLFDAILGESDSKIYDLTMPALTRAMKEDDLLALFRNEANALRESLKDGNIQLTGKELDMVIAQWGSLNNYRNAITKRLDEMLKPNGAVHARFLRILKPSFWTN